MRYIHHSNMTCGGGLGTVLGGLCVLALCTPASADVWYPTDGKDDHYPWIAHSGQVPGTVPPKERHKRDHYYGDGDSEPPQPLTGLDFTDWLDGPPVIISPTDFDPWMTGSGDATPWIGEWSPWTLGGDADFGDSPMPVSPTLLGPPGTMTSGVASTPIITSLWDGVDSPPSDTVSVVGRFSNVPGVGGLGLMILSALALPRRRRQI